MGTHLEKMFHRWWNGSQQNLELKEALGRGNLGRAYGDLLGQDVSAMVEQLSAEAGVEERIGEV